MKRNYIILLFIVLGFGFLKAQDNNVGMGTLTPHSSALLELNALDRGFLTTRMSLAQRNLIGSPATGLLIHQLDNNPGFWYWDGTQWLRWAAINVGLFVYGSGADGQVAVWSTSSTITGTNELFYDYTNGFLGVGTTTPREYLEVDGAIKVGNNNATLPGTIRWTGTDFEGYDGTNWYSFTSSTLTGSGARGQVTFWDSPTSVSGSNNLFYDIENSLLGIGTTTPGESLEINGGFIMGSSTITLEGNMRYDNDDFEGYLDGQWVSFTSSTLSGRGADGQVTYWESSTFLSGDNDLFYDYTNTRLGIGTTTPNETVEVNGGVNVGESTSGTPDAGTIHWDGTDFAGYTGTEWKSFIRAGAFGTGDPTQIAFWVTSNTLDGDNNLYWDNVNKRVGVGTNTPNYLLDVVGSVGTGKDGVHGRLNLFSEQGLTDYDVTIVANPSSTTSMTFTLPPTKGVQYDVLVSDGNGELTWVSPFLVLGYYWEENNDVLSTVNDWGIARYGNVLTGDTKKQINFGFSSTSGSAYSSVMGGLLNTASASFSVVTGGQGNTASGAYSFVSGGLNNFASGNYSYAFGSGNNSSGNYSSISQGTNLTLSGNNSYAFRGGVTTSSHTLTGDNTYYVLDSKFLFNVNNADYDFYLDGDNNDNILFADVSSDRIGINVTAPSYLLEVEGAIQMSNTTNSASKLYMFEDASLGTQHTSISASSQTATMDYYLPEWHNVNHSGLFNDGTGNLSWKSPQEITSILTRVLTTVTDNYTATRGDIHIYADNSAEMAITLPPAADVEGKEFYLKKSDLSSSKVWINPQVGETLDGDGPNLIYLNQDFEAMMVVSDGTEWFIMSHFQGW